MVVILATGTGSQTLNKAKYSEDKFNFIVTHKCSKLQSTTHHPHSPQNIRLSDPDDMVIHWRMRTAVISSK